MLACPKCTRTLPAQILNSPEWQPCPNCQAPTLVTAFPALWVAPVAGSSGEALLVEGESSCFYHAEKRAAVACESCGRFICGLCDIELEHQHLCPLCVQSGKRKGKLKVLENQRMRYDALALTLAVLPLLIFYFTIITAPAAVYIALRHWNAPRSVVGGGRWRLVLALILALLQISGWVLGIYYLTKNWGTRG